MLNPQNLSTCVKSRNVQLEKLNAHAKLRVFRCMGQNWHVQDELKAMIWPFLKTEADVMTSVQNKHA